MITGLGTQRNICQSAPNEMQMRAPHFAPRAKLSPAPGRQLEPVARRAFSGTLQVQRSPQRIPAGLMGSGSHPVRSCVMFNRPQPGHRPVASLTHQTGLSGSLAAMTEAESPSLETRAILIETLMQIDAMLDSMPTKVRKAFLLAGGSGYLVQSQLPCRSPVSSPWRTPTACWPPCSSCSGQLIPDTALSFSRPDRRRASSSRCLREGSRYERRIGAFRAKAKLISRLLKRKSPLTVTGSGLFMCTSSRNVALLVPDVCATSGTACIAWFLVSHPTMNMVGRVGFEPTTNWLKDNWNG